MAGSPKYLELLGGMREHIRFLEEETIQGSWNALDYAWETLEENPTTDSLSGLADEAFALYMSLSGKTADEIIDHAEALHIAKNAGYAGADNPDPWANFRMCEVFGVDAYDGVLVRLSDKYIRTLNLRKDPTNERVGESLLDTLADLGAYCLIGICIYEEIG